MRLIPKHFNRIVLLLGYVLLLSCGGGGGSSTNRAPSCAGTPSVATAPVTACNLLVPTDPNDPFYHYQWHLKNTGQLCGAIGEDINVEPVWNGTPSYKGDGVRIAIVDDGLEIGHPDLAANVVTGGSYDYRLSPPAYGDPTGGAHGTSVAGVAAAVDFNRIGVRGVAPHGRLVGYNVLQAPTTTNEADAMTLDAPLNSVSSNSWGAPDGNGTLDAPSSTWRTAIETGLATGRGGLGLIYVWAAGNGAPIDNSNYDGQANYRGVIAVGATNDTGTKASYSEHGANLWVSAPAGETCGHAITTTDRTGTVGYNPTQTGGSDLPDQNYTECFNGTSAATPEVSGVVALMLQARPALTWRDVRLILAETARKNDRSDSGWTSGAISPGGTAYHFNHKYGFGVVDAKAAVSRAASWSLISGTQRVSPPFSGAPNIAIPDNDCTGVSDTINVSQSGINQIEWVEVTFTAADHPYSGDLNISLTSPTGAVSQLAETHNCPAGCTAYSGWVFGSARHLGEAADGNWKLTVKDQESLDVGTFQSWSIQFYGR